MSDAQPPTPTSRQPPPRPEEESADGSGMHPAGLEDNPQVLARETWLRRNPGLEFDRFAFFTDAVFAIALTLLVVALALPDLSENSTRAIDMLRALDRLAPDVIGFFIAFILIARYWLAHHTFVAQLRAVDRPLMSINLLYLAFVAFLPFPSGLVGKYEQNPISVLLFAFCLAVISSLEVVMFSHAHKAGLMRKAMPEEVYRWGKFSALTPVCVFILSAPLAFVSTTLTLISWMITIPIGMWFDRHAPEGVEDYLLGVSPKRKNGHPGSGKS